MKPRFNLWLEAGGKVVLSEWRVQLLEAIDAAGSISGGAARLGVPYRRAWVKLQEIERGLGVRVIATATGGRGGGGARLTPAGRRAIERFHRFADGFAAEVQRRFQHAYSA